ncbi:MAG: hypothetical protein IJV93_10810 [Lentisphaeria bacterium]|nr:hypothetical protein [Lentisphaeria bacterium]
MQTLTKILKLDGGAGSWCTEKGVLTTTPSLAIGLLARFNLDLRTKETDAESILKSVKFEEFSGITNWYIAVDADFNQATAPLVFKSGTVVTVTTTAENRTVLSFEAPNTGTSALLEAVGKAKSIALQIEIGGFDSSGQLVFLVQFPLQLHNRVWVKGSEVPPEVASDPEYLTAAQVKALIAEATRSETPGPAGTTPHIGGNGNWWIGETDTGVKAAGKDGKDGEDAEPARNGNDGKSAYQIAVDNGFAGTVTQWLEELKGEPGTGLQVNATGELAELHAYDDAPAGFVFAASVVDSVAKTTTKYYYVKASDLEGDWCEPPLIDTTYLHTPEIRSLDPVPFKYEPKEYLQLSLKSYSNAWLAAVTIDTEDGELQLLPGTTGIKRVLRDKNGMLKIWFGSAVPAYETGKLYFTQFLGLTESITPEPEPDTATFYYGVLTDGTITSVTQITAEHLTQLTSVTAAGLGKTSLGIVPAGSWPVVVVPEGYAAYKDDGLGGLAPFALDNGMTGTGANGTVIDGVGKVYGEFKLAAAEIFFYVGQV